MDLCQLGLQADSVFAVRWGRKAVTKRHKGDSLCVCHRADMPVSIL